ncbi:MAG: hypothetical protein K6C12_06420 [Oscillospiraceae bacterium]|nr:hypothetical protein [Oscillospiraceae bacterium]
MTEKSCSSVSQPLRERLIQYIRRSDPSQPISSIAKLAKSFNVSNRQLLRVMKELCGEGILEHRQKEIYGILRMPEQERRQNPGRVYPYA